MIDFHSHILPALDDGSKSVEESVQMLSLLRSQGVKTVVATPHFYANNESVSSFIARRHESYQKLVPHLDKNMPGVILGAEVMYYDGISRLDDLDKLKIQGSDLLLVEMPFAAWTDYTLRELAAINSRGNTTLLLAHIERYLKYQPGYIINDLVECGVLLQINTSFITDFFTRRKALRMLSSGLVHCIGSDCHGATVRSPDMGTARDYIIKKSGKNLYDNIVSYGNSLFREI